MSLVVPDHGCGREVLGRVSLRASFGRFLVVSDRDVAGRCRGGCCLGCECRWWCLIPEWGGMSWRVWVSLVVVRRRVVEGECVAGDI